MMSYLVFLLLILTTHTCGENPAIKLILTEKGLQYGKQMGAGILREKMESISIPEISGGISIGPLGTVEYILSGMSVSQCDFPEPSLDFNERVGFKSRVSGLNIRVRGNWNTNFGIIHDGGSFDLAVLNVDVTSVVGLGDNVGQLSISSQACAAGIGAVDIDFHGGASFIFQPFVDSFKGQIKGDIQGRICPGVQQQIENLEKQLAAIAVSFQVGSALVLDLPLTSSPLVDFVSLGLGLKGQFYSIRSHTDPPFQAQDFSLTSQDTYMFSLGVSEFTANTMSYSYYSDGLLVAHINDSNIPEHFPLRLNTSSFGTLIPQLPKLFPGLLMELSVSAREVPMFSFLSGEVQLSLPGMITAFAVQRNTTLTPLFKLQAASVFTGQISISGGRVRGSTVLSNFTLTLASSEVGPFKTEAIGSLMKIGIQMGVLPKLNAKLREGLVLPSPHDMQLVNPVLKVEKGTVVISSDFGIKVVDRGH